MRDTILYSAVFGFAAGVLVRSFWNIHYAFIFFLVFISLCCLGYYFLISKKAKTILFISIFLLSSAFGAFRFELSAKNIGDPLVDQIIGKKTTVVGIIDDEPTLREKNIALTIHIKQVGGENTKSGAEVLVTTSFNTHYAYGDTVRLSGILEKPENFATDQGKIFDYINYLRKDGIFYVSQNPSVEIISHGGGSFVKRALFSAKEKFLEKINGVIPIPESTLMGGLILGEKSSFSSDLRQSFVNTGTIHIVALSGYNVTIVAGWVMDILSFFPRNFSFAGGIITIILFVIMTGGASTAVRAGTMAVLALVARATGRNYDAGRALVIAGVAMILINPFILAFDVSFQLSFLATIAVIYLSPRVEKYFMWIRWTWLRDIFSITLSAYVFVMPFILYVMGNLSLVALPANFAVLPLIPFTMILGFATGFAGLISGVLSYLPAKLAYFLLHYELVAIGFFAHLPFSSLSIPNFPLLLTILIYIVFFYELFGKTKITEDPVPVPPKIKTGRPLIKIINFRSPFFAGTILLVIIPVGLLYFSRFESVRKSHNNLMALLSDIPSHKTPLDPKTASANCHADGPLPDHSCSPGAIFEDATVAQICVSGYTKTVRDVPQSLRIKVFTEYGIALPVPFGSYENDHIIPLELGGSNDIANLFPELAKPIPGFHEKDVVENYLHQEVCAGRVALAVAQKQIATDWTAVYENLSPEEITALKKKFQSWAGN